MRKIIAVALIILMLLSSGCSKDIKLTTGLSKDEIFKISGQTEKLPEILLVLVNEKNQYEENLGTDIWSRTFGDASLEEEIKSKVKNQMVELSVIYQMALDEGMKLSSSEEETLSLAAAEYFSALRDAEKEAIGVTEETVYHLYEKMYLTEKFYELKTEEEGREISDEDARVIDVLYIYFQTADRDIYGNAVKYEEDRIARIQSEAQSVLDRINQGEDFQSLAVSESDDTEYESIFGRGTMEEHFETAAFGLTDGETSGLVETEDGYYIIKCVNDYLEKETEENKQNLQEKYKADKFREVYEPFLEKQTLEFHNKVWDKISISEYSDCTTGNIYDVYNSYFE